MSAISAPTTISPLPSGRSSVTPSVDALFRFAEKRVSPLIASAPTTAPNRLVMPPIDEHREADERQLQVQLVGGEAPEHVDVETARPARRARPRGRTPTAAAGAR